ncbi:unnamed protein product [Brassica rapa subsp. narinosa]
MPSSSSHCCKPTRTVVRRSPLYPPIVEAPPPPYPPTRTRFQDYYSGYGQLHPPPLRPFRDEYYGEGEYEGCFPFLRTW